MEVPTNSFRALTEQVEQLAARVEQVARHAATLRTPEEMRLSRMDQRRGLPPGGLRAQRDRAGLHLVDGGAS